MTQTVLLALGWQLLGWLLVVAVLGVAVLGVLYGPTWLKARVSAAQYEHIRTIVGDMVICAEQTMKPNEPDAKFAKVRMLAESWLASMGWGLQAGVLDALIEAAVHYLPPTHPAPTTSTTPAA